eukprot:scaffold205241_cov15-Tisochrysis_lutea.AAC.1
MGLKQASHMHQRHKSAKHTGVWCGSLGSSLYQHTDKACAKLVAIWIKDMLVLIGELELSIWGLNFVSRATTGPGLSICTSS